MPIYLKQSKMKRLNQITDEELFGFIGKKLREMRRENGMTTYQEFAENIGMSKNTYFKMEAGNPIKISTLKKVLNYYNMTFNEFFFKCRC